VGGTAEDVVLSFPNADEVDDSSTTNKFVNQAEKQQISTNQIQISTNSGNISDLENSIAAIDLQKVLDVGETAAGSISVSGNGAGTGAFINIDNSGNIASFGYQVFANGSVISVDDALNISIKAQGGSQISEIKVSPTGISLEVDSETRPISIPTLPQDDSLTEIIARDGSGVLKYIDKSTIGGGGTQALVTAISPINQGSFGVLVCFPIIPVSGQAYSSIRLTLNISNKAGATNPQALGIYYSTNSSQDTTGDTLFKSIPIDIDAQTAGVPFEVDVSEAGTLPTGTFYFKSNNVGSDFETTAERYIQPKKHD
jgi:hypothetical protein